MNKNTLLCIQGKPAKGKTTLINKVAKLLKDPLKKEYGFEDETTSIIKELGLNESKMPKDPRDCWLVLKKDEKIIIIQSEGDYVYSYKNTETYLRKSKQESILVLCALRTDDKQTRLIEELNKIRELCRGEYHGMELDGSAEREKQIEEQVVRYINAWK